MASSQIQIASVPYEHVLRDHNRRMRERERECSSKARMAFQKNIDELVRDHLSSCWGEKEVESEAMRRRQTRTLDRWAARQAKEMMTSIDRQTNEAELLAVSDSHNNVSERPTTTTTFLRESSPSQSDSSVDVPKLRASSLVQMWKEFEAEAMTPRGGNQSGSVNSNSNSNRYARMNSTVSTNGSSVGESPLESEIDERFGNVEAIEDSFMEWESEQMTSRQNSDVSEGVRVADIVKKLTSGTPITQSSINSSSSNDIEIEHDHPHPHPHPHPVVREPPVSNQCVSDQGVRKDLKLTKKRLRLRGRQATKDLLMQMEQERRRELIKLAERHAVSLFQHRGRIQAMLRLKFLQRETAIHDQRRPASTKTELDQLHGRSSIFLLRERFNTKPKKDGNAPVLNENNLHTRRKLRNKNQDSGSVPVLDVDNLQTRLKLQNATQTSGSAQLNGDPGKAPVLNEDSLQAHTQLLNATQDSSNSGVFDQPTSQDVHRVEVKTIEHNAQTVTADQSTEGSGNGPVLNENKLKGHLQVLIPNQDPCTSAIFGHLASQDGLPVDVIPFEHSAQTVTGADSLPSTSEHNGPTEYRTMLSSSERIQETNCCTSDFAQQSLCLDNLDSEGPTDNEGSSRCWRADVLPEESVLNTMQHITSVDRWEMLKGVPDSNTIRLMESTESSLHYDFSFPETDWESRRQTWYNDWLEHDSENEEMHGLFERRTVSNLLSSSFRDRMERMIFSHIRSHPEIFESEQEETIGHHYQEASQDPGQLDSPSLQLPMPTCLRLWGPDQESSDGSTQVPYASQQPPQPSSSDYQDSQQCSPFTKYQSIEMEMMYEMKGQMERLQDEMSELREFVKSCMGMQVKLQNSIKQEVAAAVCHSMTAIQGGDVTESSIKVPKKNGNCCICCSSQVDSLLYRCGHMCTCFKCAHELQWSSSKCPICRAPIDDVVRAYSDL